MKIIDSRSGQVMVIGDVARYPDGEFIRLIDFDAGLFSATADLELGIADLGGRVVTIRRTVPLTVRWFHPSFLLQHIGFIET